MMVNNPFSKAWFPGKKKRGIQGETSLDSHNLTTGGMGFKVIARESQRMGHKNTCSVFLSDGNPRVPSFCVWEFYAIYL